MKPVLISAVALLLLSTVVLGQETRVAQQPSAENQIESVAWQRYTVKGEYFSVELPAHPSMSTGERRVGRGRDMRREVTLGAYADGVVYMVYILENLSSDMSFGDFCKTVSSLPTWDRASERKVTLKETSGRQYFSLNSLGGTVQMFSDYGRLYRFQAFGAPLDHPRVKQFFSSIVLSENESGERVSVGLGVPLNTGQLDPKVDPTVFKGLDVDRKALVVVKPEPQYTVEARGEQLTGTVVLRVVFAADGNVTEIEIRSGLPYGLTENAIEAAKKIKFIPAARDGKFVSMRFQLEYNFNLY